MSETRENVDRKAETISQLKERISRVDGWLENNTLNPGHQENSLNLSPEQLQTDEAKQMISLPDLILWKAKKAGFDEDEDFVTLFKQFEEKVEQVKNKLSKLESELSRENT